MAAFCLANAEVHASSLAGRQAESRRGRNKERRYMPFKSKLLCCFETIKTCSSLASQLRLSHRWQMHQRNNPTRVWARRQITAGSHTAYVLSLQVVQGFEGRRFLPLSVDFFSQSKTMTDFWLMQTNAYICEPKSHKVPHHHPALTWSRKQSATQAKAWCTIMIARQAYILGSKSRNSRKEWIWVWHPLILGFVFRSDKIYHSYQMDRTNQKHWKSTKRKALQPNLYDW